MKYKLKIIHTNQLWKRNIIVKETEKDDNFFFYAISYYLHNTEEYFPNYREIVFQ